MQSTASRICGQKRATPADAATEAGWRLRSAYPQEGWRGKESQRPARKQARKVFALPIALPLYEYRLPWGDSTAAQHTLSTRWGVWNREAADPLTTSRRGQADRYAGT